MMLPFGPEPAAALTARYKDALTPVVDVDAVANGAAPPSSTRRHVFDWEDGLRLIISRDRLPNGMTGLHLSASMETNFPLWHSVKDGRLTQDAFFGLVVVRWQTLSGDDTHLPLLVMITPKGVPHFLLQDGH